MEFGTLDACSRIWTDIARLAWLEGRIRVGQRAVRETGWTVWANLQSVASHRTGRWSVIFRLFRGQRFVCETVIQWDLALGIPGSGCRDCSIARQFAFGVRNGPTQCMIRAPPNRVQMYMIYARYQDWAKLRASRWLLPPPIFYDDCIILLRNHIDQRIHVERGRIPLPRCRLRMAGKARVAWLHGPRYALQPLYFSVGRV